jgi:hypothetical protein
VRARSDARTLVGALVAGGAFDVAVRNGPVTVSGAALVVMTALCLAMSGRLQSWGSRGLVALTPLLSAALVFRSSTWVVIVVGCAIATVLALAVSLAEDGSFRSTFPALAGRFARVSGHFVLGLGMLRTEPGQERESVVRERAASLARGGAIAVPILVVIGALLASADPVFEAWFDVEPIVENLWLVGIGGAGLLGLVRAASAKEPVPDLPAAPRLGTVEVVSVLGSLCLLYAAFVVAQIVALTGGADHVLETSGLTYAEYARSGFFQLLAAASITVVVLLSLRACADRSRPAVLAVSEATVVLTLAVVVVAVRRLDLYESVFGLTMLRLASTVTAVWIGVVFVLIGVAVARRRSTGRWLAPTVVFSAVAFVAVWAAADPAAVVAQHNLRRDTAGSTFDVAQAVSLGPDAVPTLVAGLDDLDQTDRRRLRSTLCARRTEAGRVAAYNHAETRADEALDDVC